ncbi:MAG: hypothetical protein J5956_13105 [Ruminococcus sp.]|nr:hypothetical protein [Ruminococcus sp.]
MKKLCVIVLSALIVSSCSESNINGNKSSSDSGESKVSSMTTLSSITSFESTTSLLNKETPKNEQTGSQNDYKELIIGCWKETQGVFTHDLGYIQFGEAGKLINPFTGENYGEYSIENNTFKIDGGTYDIVEITFDRIQLEYEYEGNKKQIALERREPSEQDREDNNENTANANAKMIYTTITNMIADLNADGEKVSDIKTEVVSVESLSGGDDPFKDKIYAQIKKLVNNSGYVYISYSLEDPNDENFVIWSKRREGTVLGHYPPYN